MNIERLVEIPIEDASPSDFVEILNDFGNSVNSGSVGAIAFVLILFLDTYPQSARQWIEEQRISLHVKRPRS